MEYGSAKIRIAKIAAREVRTRQIRGPEVGTLKIHAGHIDATEVGSTPINASWFVGHLSCPPLLSCIRANARSMDSLSCAPYFCPAGTCQNLLELLFAWSDGFSDLDPVHPQIRALAINNAVRDIGLLGVTESFPINVEKEQFELSPIGHISERQWCSNRSAFEEANTETAS